MYATLIILFSFVVVNQLISHVTRVLFLVLPVTTHTRIFLQVDLTSLPIFLPSARPLWVFAEGGVWASWKALPVFLGLLSRSEGSDLISRYGSILTGWIKRCCLPLTEYTLVWGGDSMRKCVTFCFVGHLLLYPLLWFMSKFFHFLGSFQTTLNWEPCVNILCLCEIDFPGVLTGGVACAGQGHVCISALRSSE